MSKVEVKILGLSYTKSDNYLIILSELESNRKLPIVINPHDAQFIAVKHNSINTTKPATQDTLVLLLDVYKIDVQEIVIYSYVDGMFFSKLITSNSVDNFEIECSVSTAISLAAACNCPIYVEDSIMDEKSLDLDEGGNPIQTKKMPPLKKINPPKLSKSEQPSIENLGKMLEEAVEREDFELAVTLRDKIDKLKKV